MSIFIKPGFWDERPKAPKHWLNLTQLITSIVNSLLPSSQVNSDWDATSGVAEILNKPNIPNPIPYKIYAALLTQSGENAPVATVLYNDLSASITWTRQGPGQYYCNVTAGIFTDNKTGVLINNVEPNFLPLSGNHITCYLNSSSLVTVTTGLPQQEGGIGPSDGILYKTYVEIKVFN
jgi:hypothetical protein